VEEPIIYPLFRTSSWSQAWASSLFRKKAIIAILLFIALVLFLPHFFSVIETRQGIVLNDWLLSNLPARDFSFTIFIFVWSTSLLIIFRSVQQPRIFLTTIYLMIVMTIIRLICISIFALDPPPGLIGLKDPLTSLTYGGTDVFITRDLFFSGHTSNLFLIYLCLQKKRDKQFALMATIIVGMLVLVQHVHYTIDVIAAIIFTWCLFALAKRNPFFQV